MAKYILTAPNGVEIEVESDTEPTEELAQQVFDAAGVSLDKDKHILGKVATFDRGATFGLGRKAGGLVNAAGSYIADAGYRAGEVAANIKNKGLKGAFDDMEQLPSFWDRYHSVVDPAMQDMEAYQQEHPVEAFAVEMAGGMVNPANKVGAGWIGKGGSTVGRLARSGAVGTAMGGVAGGMNTENVENLGANAAVGSVFGGVLGVTLPVAIGTLTRGIGMMRSNTKKGLEYLRRELGDDAVNAMIKEAQESGRPIIEVANDKALKLGQAARMQTPEAMDAFDAAAERFKNTMTDRNSAFIDENLGSLNRFDSIEALEEEAKKKAAPLYENFYQRGDLAVEEINQKLKMINPDRYKDVTPQGGLSADEYANLVRQQADELGVNIAKGDEDALNRGVMHFVVNENGKKSNRAPFINTLSDTYRKPDITITRSGDKNLIRAIRDTVRNKRYFDNLVTRNNELYTKYPTSSGNIAKKIRNPHDDLSISGGFLSDMGISPSEESNYSISSLENYVKENPFIQQEIGKIRKNPLFQTEYKLSELPDTDARILDQVNKNINDQISTAIRNGENETVRLLERQKHDLLNMVDEVSPEYKEARALYEDARRFKKAANVAEKILKPDTSKEAFAKTYNDMSATERDALKIGLRDEIYKIIGNRENETLGWRKVVPSQVQDKIRKVLGREEGNKLIAYANREIKAMRNYNKVTQGSKTAEKTDLEKAINWKRELANIASLGAVGGRNKGIANVMVNPNAGEVASVYEQLSNPRWGEAIYQRYLGYTPEMIALGNYLARQQ